MVFVSCFGFELHFQVFQRTSACEGHEPFEGSERGGDPKYRTSYAYELHGALLFLLIVIRNIPCRCQTIATVDLGLGTTQSKIILD